MTTDIDYLNCLKQSYIIYQYKMERNLSMADLERIGVEQSKLNELFNRKQRSLKSYLQTGRIVFYAEKRAKLSECGGRSPNAPATDLTI